MNVPATLHPHRFWIGILAVALVIGLANGPVLGIAQQKATQKLSSLHAENQKISAGLRQLQDDITASEKMKTEIDAQEIDRFLAPVDRLRAGQILERRAAEALLTHFTYTLSPEHKTPMETVGAGRQDLATSELTLSADVPTDADAYVFLDAVRRTLPGRLTLRQISLQRVSEDAPVGASNLRLSVSGEWLSNGASQNLAEATP